MNTTPPPDSFERQTPANEQQRASPSISTLISAFAAGLGICFFVPWAGVFGEGISGFDLQKMSAQQKWLWIIPVFSVITIFAPVIGRFQKVAARLTGVLPFCVLAYWLDHIGSELLRALALGGWLSLICGLALLILAHRLK